MNNKCLEFDVFKIMKSTPVEVASRIDFLDVVDECVHKVIHGCLKQDPIEPYKDHGTSDQFWR